MVPRRYEILRSVENDRKVFTLISERPQQVWTLLNEELFNQIGLSHWHSAFIEDTMHDWTWIEGKGLRFHGHSSAAGDKVDLVLVYEE